VVRAISSPIVAGEIATVEEDEDEFVPLLFQELTSVILVLTDEQEPKTKAVPLPACRHCPNVGAATGKVNE
jgi:hypothetical protein